MSNYYFTNRWQHPDNPDYIGETTSDRIRALQERGNMIPAPPVSIDFVPIIAPMTAEQQELFGFEASDTPAERLYGYIARSLINSARYEPFTVEQPEGRGRKATPSPEHFERLTRASEVFAAAMIELYDEKYKIDVGQIASQAREELAN